jgi:DNA (cytosine-5)-methyltransferase 1
MKTYASKRRTSAVLAKRRDGRLTAIDLFSGCGGLTYGLKAAGFAVTAALEIDPIAAATYAHNHRAVSIMMGDIRAINPYEWMRVLHLAPGQLDLLAGCPPCQGFSTLRTRNGSKRNRDRQNLLMFEMLRFAAAFLPKAIMIENVPGLQSHRLFRDFLAKLRQAGYRVRYRIEDVRFFGVPQRRRRLILLAGRKISLEFAPRTNRIVTVKDAIGFLPQAGKSGDPLHDYPERRMQRTRALISSIPRNGGSRLDLARSKQLRCHQDCDGYKDIYGRMSWNKVSPTITTGCYNPSKGRFLHPEKNRCITMREAALLQSFPSSFEVAWGTTKTQTARMLGNALPPEFIRRQAIQIRQAIEAAR